MENFQKRLKAELFNKDDNEKVIKEQSKLTFNGNRNSYTFYDSYTFN